MSDNVVQFKSVQKEAKVKKFLDNINTLSLELTFLLRNIAFSHNTDVNIYDNLNLESNLALVNQFLDAIKVAQIKGFTSVYKSVVGMQLNSDTLTDDGKIIVTMNTSNEYKKKSLEDFFKLNIVGKRLSEIFEFNFQESTNTSDETIVSMLENAIVKAEDLHKDLPNVYTLGDDSGTCSSFLSGLLFRSTSNKSLSNVFPGAVSKRIADRDILKIFFSTVYDTYIANKEDSGEFLEEFENFYSIIEMIDKDKFSIHTYNSLVLITIVAYFIEYLDLNDSEDSLMHMTFMSYMASFSPNGNILTSSALANGELDFAYVKNNSDVLDSARIPSFLRDITAQINSYGEIIEGAHGYNAVFNIGGLGHLSKLSNFDIINNDHRSKAIGSILLEIFKDYTMTTKRIATR